MDFLTPQQAAEILGVSAGRVRQLIAEKRLPTMKFGNVNMIKREDLHLVINRPTGRPKKVTDTPTVKPPKAAKQNKPLGATKKPIKKAKSVKERRVK